jgi:hypothetical protein
MAQIQLAYRKPKLEKKYVPGYPDRYRWEGFCLEYNNLMKLLKTITRRNIEKGITIEDKMVTSIGPKTKTDHLGHS